MIDPVSLMLSNGADFWQRKFYVGSNTVGTAIATNTDPIAIAATEGMLSIYNSASTTGDDNRNTIIMPLYIKLVCTVINASSTDFSMRVATDTIQRYSTGGTQLTMNSTFVNSDTAGAARPTAVGEVYFGDLTLAAVSSEAQIGQVVVRAGGSAQGQVVGDEYLIGFGNYQNSGNTTLSAAASKSMTKNLSPVFLGPGSSLIVQPLATAGAATGASFNVEVGVIELYHNPKRS